MKDILLDIETNELVFQDGDFAIGSSTKQHQKHLLLAGKGVYKQWAETGIGVQDFLEGEDQDDLMRETRKEFVRDGMVINDLKADANGITVDAEYK